MTNAELLLLRSKVDAIDSEIIQLLGQRFGVTAEIGKLKSQVSLAPVDPDREARQTERYRQLAARNGIDPEMTVAVFRVIIDEVVRQHRAV